jgi:hypothetical protein
MRSSVPGRKGVERSIYSPSRGADRVALSIPAPCRACRSRTTGSRCEGCVVLVQGAGVCRAGLRGGGGIHGSGNWATDLAGGSRFGYTLLSVILMNSRPLAAMAWTVAATIVGLNGWLLVGTFRMWLA